MSDGKVLALAGELQRQVAARMLTSPEAILLDADIVGDLGLESIEVVTFLLEVEQRYPPVAFEDLQAGEVRTLRDLAAHIVARQSP